MPRAIPMPIRQQIITRHLQGESLPHLAAALHLRPATVRHIWGRYRTQGAAGLTVQYTHCGPQAPRASQLIYRAALTLRRRHPTWGAGLIHYLLGAKWPTQPRP